MPVSTMTSKGQTTVPKEVREALAEAMGVSRNHIADIELGARNTGIWSLLLIARCLGLDASSLFEDFDRAALRRLTR